MITGPNEVVRFRMEMEYAETEGIWYGRGVIEMPRSTSICRVEELPFGGDGVCTIWRVFMVIKCQESCFGLKLLPPVSLIARLPEGVVCQANENGLDPLQRFNPKGPWISAYHGLLKVCELDHERWEFELYGY